MPEHVGGDRYKPVSDFEREYLRIIALLIHELGDRVVITDLMRDWGDRVRPAIRTFYDPFEGTVYQLEYEGSEASELEEE